MALLYAAVFFLAGIFPSLISKADRAVLFGAVVQWLPSTLSIAVALFVAAVVTNPRLSPRAAAAIAIVFEIASSYGIAAAELLQPKSLDFRNATWIGLSWGGMGEVWRARHRLLARPAAIKLIRPGRAVGHRTRSHESVRARGRKRSRACAHPTPWTSSTSASRTMGLSTM